MVQRLAAHFGGANENFELLTNLGLTHIVVKQFRAQRALNGFFLRCLGFCVHHARGRWGAKVVGLNAHVVILFGQGLECHFDAIAHANVWGQRLECQRGLLV